MVLKRKTEQNLVRFVSRFPNILFKNHDIFFGSELIYIANLKKNGRVRYGRFKKIVKHAVLIILITYNSFIQKTYKPKPPHPLKSQNTSPTSFRVKKIYKIRIFQC